MDLTDRELDESIFYSPKFLDNIPSGEPLEKLKAATLAMGFVFGVYEEQGVNDRGVFRSYGPNREQALADRFAIFYKNGKIFARATAC